LRYRLMATYQGSPFEAGIGPTDGDIVLFAACPPPEELGFEPATGHWRKQLRFSEVQAIWESKPIGKFRGERCMVLDDLGDRLHIGYLGHDGYKAEQLGFWQVDRGVFELVAPRNEVSDILEERAEYRRTGSSTDGAGWPAPRPNDSAGYPIPARNNSAGYRTPIADELAGYLAPSADLPELASYGNSAAQSAPAYSWQPEDTGQFGAAGVGTAETDGLSSPAYRAVPDGITGVALPIAAEAPLPLDAAALRAASAARRPQRAAPLSANTVPTNTVPASTVPANPVPANPVPANPVPANPVRANPVPANTASASTVPASTVLDDTRSTQTVSAGTGPAVTGPTGAGTAGTRSAGPGQTGTGPAHTGRVTAAPSRLRRAGRRRMATERLFADLASLAGIPSDAYAIGEDVEGALCLVQAGDSFEVYHSANGAQHELQVFETEESACFYLFGVLAAEAVRNGILGRVPTDLHASPAR
jgi:hypothetical protein